MYSELEMKLHVESRLKFYTLGSFWYSYRLMLSAAVNSLLFKRNIFIGKIFLTVHDFKLFAVF